MFAPLFAPLFALLFALDAAAAVRFVLSIGNDVGDAHEAPLRWAEADAVRVREVFVDLGGVSRDRASTVLGDDVAAVERTLLLMRGQVQEAKRRGDRVELVVSYSGHGDREALHLGDERLPLDRFYDLIDDVGADAVIVFLDACRSPVGGANRSRGASRQPAFDVELIDELLPSGRVVLAAASDGEAALESDDLEGAFFTHHLLAGLRGAADVDGDGAIGLSELYRYAHASTLRASYGQSKQTAPQHPELTAALVGQGELIITRLDRAQATVVIAGDVVGDVLLADARSARVHLEVHAAGAPLRLAIPPGRLQLVLRDGRQAAIAERDVARGSVVTVSRADFVEAPSLAVRARGVDVDATPWGLRLQPVFSTSATVPTWSSGLRLGVERRVLHAPIFIGLEVQVGQAGGPVLGGPKATGVDDVIFTEHCVRVTMPISGELWTPLGRGTGAVVVGAEAIEQVARRLDRARRLAAGFAPGDVHQQAMGGVIAVRAGWWVPLAFGVAVVADVEGGGRLVPAGEDRGLTMLPWAAMAAGMGYEF